MDTLHFDPLNSKTYQSRRMEEMNLSELETFMLRGRRLQAQAIGDALRNGFARLRRLFAGAGQAHGAHRPRSHGRT
jgi:hypothetical protein